MFDTLQCLNEIVDLINDHIVEMLPKDVTPPQTIRFGDAYTRNQYQVPAIFIYPDSVTPDPDAQCIWQSSIAITIDVLLRGPNPDQNDLDDIGYVDALQNLFIKYPSTDHTWDITPGIGEHYIGATRNEKLATVSITCTVRTGE